LKRKNEYKWLLVIILTGLFLRAFHPLQLFQYGHDNDLTGWFIRDVLINHHLRLIGQETSSHGIFIGPYFYYLQIPFYVLAHMDPSGSILLPIILGVFAIWSIHFTFSKMFNTRTANIAALVYALSTLIIFTDREVVPTMPVMLWTVWYLFALSRVMKKQNYGYIIIGLLIGLIWSINLQLVILLPLVIVAMFFSRKTKERGLSTTLKMTVLGTVIAIILNIPFAAFEVRHGFQQTKALVTSLTTNKDYVAGTSSGFIQKLDRTMQLVYRNSTNIFGANVLNLDGKIMFWVLVVAGAFMIYKKKIDIKIGIILFLWQLIYILFFSKVSLNISEYYLNGMNVVFILIAACGVNEIIRAFHETPLHKLGYLIIALFVILNLYSFFTRPVNADGYLERKAVIAYIKEDSKRHNYPCVSLSFIVSPGNDLGYRYFIWEGGLKTKPISNSVPVYSIVFPLSKVSGFDKSIGSLGVVLPDYKRYNDNTIQKACEGDDFTTAQPMFGFTD
jgi:hypothetical protein